MRKILLFVCIVTAFGVAKAEILMPRVFSDYMVLQREMPVKIWGKADFGSTVKVEFAGQAKEVKAGEDGTWHLYLEPMQACATNQDMKVYENEKLSKEFKDILVGEVWIAGGQSNMQLNLDRTKKVDALGDRANNPRFRLFSQSVALWEGYDPIADKEDLTPNFDTPTNGKWNLATEKTIKSFSAIAFYFSEKIIKELDVPVGIVQTALGGSKMISWIAREDLTGNETFENGLKQFDENIKNYDPNAPTEKTYEGYKIPERYKQGAGFYRHSPALMYNTKVAPLAGFTARGFIWYQGEADEANPEFALMFEKVVHSWRKYWQNEKMPFYAVQLPSFGAKTDWADTRWQQYLASKKLDNMKFLITIDTGAERSIHPADKDIVGERFANLALGDVYGVKAFENHESPSLAEVKYNASQVEVCFNTATNLKLVGDFRGFEVLLDKNWVSPKLVELKEDSIVLEVQGEILAVRYLWKNWAKPDACLYNELDLPAMNFIDFKK